VAVTISNTDASGATSEVEEVQADADGMFGGTLTYRTVDADTGAVIEDNLEWPAGTYTVSATQGELAASVTFTVGDDDGGASPTEGDSGDIPGKGDGDNGSNDGLAVTGANETAMFAGIAAGVLALALGLTLMLVRRRGDA
jgi:hypothetical protein